MSTIIGLRGVGNSGKSTTVRRLHDLVLQNGFGQISSNFNPNRGDFIAIFSKNGKKLGMTSSGDRYDLVRDRLQELVNSHCDVCVCACRTYGGTNTAISGFTAYTNQYVEKTVDNNQATQATTNMNDARTLLTLINTLI